MLYLEDGVELASYFERLFNESKVGVHVGLTGSCLFWEESDNDIDLIVYLHSTEKPYTYQKIVKWLRAYGVKKIRRCKHKHDNKVVYKSVFKHDDRKVKIDWFFLF